MKKLCRQCLNPNEKGICTCGENKDEYGTPTPPVNESWRNLLNKMWIDKAVDAGSRLCPTRYDVECFIEFLFSISGKEDGVKSQFTVQESETLKNEIITSCTSWSVSYMKEKMDLLLSTARQEAKAQRTEEIRKALHEEPVVLVDTRFNPDDKPKYEHAILYDRIKQIIDSLTSKGGTNGL
jgi:hypothetical protein